MKRRTWKRTLRMVLLLLTAGAILNVAVAWGCSFNAPSLAIRGFSQPAVQEAAAVWNRYAQPGTPPAPSAIVFANNVYTSRQGELLRDGLVSEGGGSQTTERFGIEQVVVTRCETVAIGAQKNPNPMKSERWVICEFRVGLPIRCLFAGTFQSESTGAFKITGGFAESIGAIPVGFLNTVPAPTHSLLPYFVLPSGFIFNTIFYAAILWLLFAAPFALRRRIRARRGQCPGCAYPIGTSDVCTECGAAVSPRA